MLQLIIERTGKLPIQMTVDERATIASCIAQLVDQLDYPKKNALGQPITYQLARGSLSLPKTYTWSRARIASGTHLILESIEVNAATKPLTMQVSAPARSGSARWSRRSVLVGAFLGIPFAGLLAGFGTAFAQVALTRETTSGLLVAHVPVSPTPIPRDATVRLTFFGHEQTVRSVAWSPSGLMLASGGDDAQLLIWGPDATIQQRIAQKAPVSTIAWSPDSLRLTSGAGRHVTFLMMTGEILSRSSTHKADVSCVAWSHSQESLVVSGGLDRQAIVWETTSYKPQAVFTGHNTALLAVTWAPNAHTIASSSAGGVVRVWNAKTGQEIHGFYQDATVPMTTCAFALGGSALAVAGIDGIIRIWDGLVCHQMRQTENEGEICQDMPQRLSVSASAIRATSWSPDGRYLATGSDDGTLAIWSPTTRQEPLLTRSVEGAFPVLSIAWAPDGHQLATASGRSVTIWTLL